MSTKPVDLWRSRAVFHWVSVLVATMVLLSGASAAIPSVLATPVVPGNDCWTSKLQYRIGEPVTVYVVVQQPQSYQLVVSKPDGSQVTIDLGSLAPNNPQTPYEYDNLGGAGDPIGQRTIGLLYLVDYPNIEKQVAYCVFEVLPTEMTKTVAITITETTTATFTIERTTTRTETMTVTSTRERTTTVTSTACLLPVPATQCGAVTIVILVVLVLLVTVLSVEVRRLPRKPSAPPTATSELASVTQRVNEIENLGKARPATPLGNAMDVERVLQSIKGSMGKLGDVLKRLEAAKDEKEVVETLVEFTGQIRNCSDDVGSFTDFLAQRAARDRQSLELSWFNILTVNLLEMERALDCATIMVRQHPSGALLFEGLARNYTFLSSSAQAAERAFGLTDIDQINAALSTMRKAKSQLDEALSSATRGLANWYGRLSWEKYLGVATSLAK
jgi:hypothetical protein